MGAKLKLEMEQVEKLERALGEYAGNAEKAINNVLHGTGRAMIEEKVLQLMPSSGRSWRGKESPAKTSKSLVGEEGNLSITVKTTKKYQYLYFPDDGMNTKHHAGNQQFFYRSGEAKKDEIIEMCINELTKVF